MRFFHHATTRGKDGKPAWVSAYKDGFTESWRASEDGVEHRPEDDRTIDKETRKQHVERCLAGGFWTEVTFERAVAIYPELKGYVLPHMAAPPGMDIPQTQPEVVW